MEKEVFVFFFYIIISFPTLSDISQHDVKMQRQYEEEQQLLLCLQEAVEACHVEHTA